MKKVILLGTGHSIQRGNNQRDDFKKFIKSICKTYSIRAIAEEIDIQSSVAQEIAVIMDISYVIIEPHPDQYKGLGIEHVHHIDNEFISKYQELPWPKNPSSHNLPLEIFEEYMDRINTTYRLREAEWLKKIIHLDTWPVLVICGATHYEPFHDLLVSQNFTVEQSKNYWGCEEL